MTKSAATDILEIIRRRPAVHRLSYGAFIQGHVWLDDRTLVVPLQAMGFDHCAGYAARYHLEIVGIDPEQQALTAMSEQGKDALPVIAFVFFPPAEDTPEAMERAAQPKLDRAEQLVGWITGDYLNDFAYLTATSEDHFIRMVPPHTRRRVRLGFGNTGEALGRSIEAINEAADANERFAFALSLYRDALHETNQQFKIARLFGVLEALAYALKAGGVGSRTAIRTMLGLEAGAVGEIKFGGRTIRYERIELSGRLRDKLFHGAQFKREDLSTEWRESFDLLTEKPDTLIDSLMSDCELEFARWANRASKARAAAEEQNG